MEKNRSTVLYIAMSLDGYIAKPGDDLSFLSIVEKEGEDYGYFSFLDTVDTVVLGSRTYDWILSQVPEFPHADLKTYVISRNKRPQNGNIEFYNGSLKELIQNLKEIKGKNIFIDGGAQVVDLLLQDQLIDEFIISIIPVLLGDGISLFKQNQPEQFLKLVDVQRFEKGLVQLHYKKG